MSDSDRMPLHVITDLNRELFERIGKTTYSMTGIVDNPFDKFQIALGALASSVAICSGFFSAAVGHKLDDPYDLALAIIQEIRDARTPADRLSMEKKIAEMLRSRK